MWRSRIHHPVLLNLRHRGDDACDVFDYAHQLRSIHSFTRLTRLSLTTLHHLGIQRLSYHHMPPPGAYDWGPFVQVIATGFPERWVRQYTEHELYRIDPITTRAAKSCWPFHWKDVGPETEEEEIFLARLEAADLGDGLAVPVFGPHGRNGYVGLGCAQPACRWSEKDETWIQFVCQAGHLRYCELLMRSLPKPTKLSEREQEILAWIARGKSNAVIGDILELSPNTVDTYTRRIFRKLDVADRVTASLRGYALGLLG